MLISLLAVRMWFLQAVESRDTEAVVLAVRTRTIKLLPERGRIFDVAGQVLADNKRILTVTIDRSVIKDPTDRLAMFQRLSGPLGMPIDLLATKRTLSLQRLATL